MSLQKNIAVCVGVVLMSCSVFGQSNDTINPTGTYGIDGKIKNGETYGYFGNIKVKKINSTKVIVQLFVCIGAPSYNHGFAYDTLEIKNNIAVYKISQDSTCKITFKFYGHGVKVDETASDYNMGCGFGHGVIAYGFFKRKSYKIPTDEELKEH